MLAPASARPPASFVAIDTCSSLSIDHRPNLAAARHHDAAASATARHTHTYTATPMGHDGGRVNPRQLSRSHVVRHNEATQTGGDTPSAMHADARYHTELTATAPATRYPLSRFVRSTFFPGLTRGTVDVSYVAGNGVDPGVIRL